MLRFLHVIAAIQREFRRTGAIAALTDAAQQLLMLRCSSIARRRTGDRFMASYEIDGVTLYVSGDLCHDQSYDFRHWCEEVMRTAEPKVIFDLTEVPRIESTCVGVIAATWVDLLTQERGMDIIPSDEVRRAFMLAGFHRVFKLRA